MTTADATTIRREIVVETSKAKAFAAFTERFGDFKPPEHNLLGSPIAETVFEPHVGGHIVDRGEDGTECRWARILSYDPPDGVVFSWDISPPGKSRLTLSAPAKSKSASSKRPRTGPASSSSTATSTATAPAGKASARASPTTEAGPSTSAGSVRSSA